MNKYINEHKKKHIDYDVRCVFKILTATNLVRYIKLNSKTGLEKTFNFSENLVLFRNKQDRYYFSEV